MSVSKKINKFIGQHVVGVARAVVAFYIIWFASGMVLVDKIDPYLFIGLWMPIGAIGALVCYRW